MPINTAPTFTPIKGTGKVVFDVDGANNYGRSVLVQADGKIVVVGFSTISIYGYVTLGRFNADGSLDSSFGENGRVIYKYQSQNTYAVSAVLQADGKIVVAGDTNDTRYISFNAVRFDVNGKLDPSFAGAGVSTSFDTVSNAVGKSVTIQTDGKVLVAGQVSWSEVTGFRSDFGLVRYHPDGSLDTSFDLDGKLVIDFSGGSDTAFKVLVQADGKILVCGVSSDIKGAKNFQNYEIVRLNSDGSLDTSFGIGGRIVESDGVFFSPNSMAIQSDGSILISSQFGYADMTDPNALKLDFLIARYTPNGQLDKTFGNGASTKIGASTRQSQGYAQTDFGTNEYAKDIIVQPDDKFIVSGIQVEGGNSFFVLARYNKDGSLDLSFDGDGKVVTKIGGLTLNASNEVGEIAYKAVLQNDGKILVSGQAFNGKDYDFALVRYNANGSLDKSFSFPVDVGSSLESTILYNQSYPAEAISKNAQVFDAELSALANGAGDYNGASLILRRESGANLNDQFVALGNLSFSNGDLLLSSVKIGTVDNSDGALHLVFNHNATQARVDEALRSLAYRNFSNDASSVIKLSWIFDDGNVGLQGSGGAANVTGTSTVQSTNLKNDHPYWIDALVPIGERSNLSSWLAGSKQYQYHFLSDAKTYAPALDPNSFTPFNAQQKIFTKKAIDYISTIVDLKFIETSNPSQLNTLTFANYQMSIGAAASAMMPSNTIAGSDVNMDALQPLALNPAEANGSNIATVFMHELGHALGLTHPFEGKTAVDDGRILPKFEDGVANTVMSYNDAKTVHYLEFSPLDIAALQYLYGVNPATRSGDDLYTINASTSNFIWDGSGDDTLSAAGLTQGVTLHLTPGFWDFVGSRGAGITSAGQVTVNFGSVIENLVGGLGDDNLFGSDGANKIDGGAGNDTIQGMAGNDSLIGGLGDDTLLGSDGDDLLNGGAGTDTVVLHGNISNYKVLKTSTGYTISDKSTTDGNDTVSNVEILKFADRTLNLQIQAQAASAPVADVTRLIELYVAFFNRVPDADGLAYWISQKVAGQTINQIAETFYSAGIKYSQLSGFSEGMSNADFINVVYRNVLGRAEGADAGGLAYWEEQLVNRTESRGSLVSTILDSAHSFKGRSDFGWVADLLDNKIAVAKVFAIDFGMNFNNPEDSIRNGMAIAAAVTPTDVSAALTLIGVSSQDMILS